MEFKSADEALRWAYGTSSRPVLKLSGIYSMRGAAATNPEMSPFERHAQAALIAGVVDAMELVSRAYVHAKYARSLDAIEHAALLTHCRKAMTPGIRAERGVVMLCSAYMGQKVPWRTLRAELHCKQDAVPILQDQVFGALERLHGSTIAFLDRQFRASGLILEVA